jgi:hypothetical protein
VEFHFIEGFSVQGRECAESDMEGHAGYVAACTSTLVQDVGREVQTGGGRRDRTRCFGIDGLVPVAILWAIFAANVWWQWDVANTVYLGQQLGIGAGKAQRSLSVLAAVDYPGTE